MRATVTVKTSVRYILGATPLTSLPLIFLQRNTAFQVGTVWKEPGTMDGNITHNYLMKIVQKSDQFTKVS